jgi:hypothetical protein
MASLYPQFGSPYYNEGNNDILNRMNAFYAEAITINQAFWSEGDTDVRYEVGDQTLFNDLYGNIPSARRRQFCFNRIRPIINMITGHQRRMRKSTIVVPVENGDQETADQFTKIMLWINNQENVLETISEAFHGSLVTGMNLLQIWVDYRNDPISGDIKVDNCPYNSFVIDPYFKKADLSDCNGIWKRTWISKRTCASLLPDKANEILGLEGNTNSGSKDDKFQFMAEAYDASDFGYKELLTYDEFYYRAYRTQKLLVDTETGETMEWDKSDDSALEAFLLQYPQVTMIKQDIPTVRMAIAVQGKIFYDGPNPLGDDYPFVPVFAYYNPQMPYYPSRVQGVVRGLRDAQYLYNRRKVIEFDMMESQINSGWIYKENALVNPKDVFLSGQGRGLALKKDAQITDVQQIIPIPVPPTVIQLSDIMAKEMPLISGVNEELLGSAMDDKAGVLSMLRQGAGLTTLQILFDQLDRSQRLLGKIILKIIQRDFMPGKVKRILGGEEPTAQFYNKAFGKYNAVVEDGLNTQTQRQMQFAQMLDLRERGVPISSEDLLEASTIQNKKTIIDNLKKQEQQQAQMQQMQMQAAIQEQQARTNLANSRSFADQGLGQERISRIHENEMLAVERKAEAKKDDQQALLNFIKSLKELEGIDIDHLSKLITLNNLMKEKERSEQVSGINQDKPRGSNPSSLLSGMAS